MNSIRWGITFPFVWCFVAVMLVAVGCSDDQAANPTGDSPSNSSSGPVTLGSAEQLPKVTFVNYSVPPGNQTLDFNTGATGALNNARFIRAGDPEMKILRILAVGGTPEFTFADASPFEVTRFFRFSPFGSDVPQFQISVNNTMGTVLTLHVGAMWEE